MVREAELDDSSSEDTTGYRYGVIGSGRQGTAAAFDLVMRGGASRVVLADRDMARAQQAADRVNALTQTQRAEAVQLDARDEDSARSFLVPLDAAISAASYKLNLGLSRAALAAGTHLCDLGGNTTIVREQLKLDADAKERRICIVPDCGEAPGLTSNLMAYACSLIDEPSDLLLLDGGLPLKPSDPWNYVLTFNFDGLINEYDGHTWYVRDGQVVEIDCFDPSEYELVEFEEPFGTLEAFVAAGGSTTPWTLGQRLKTLRSKVLRYPGHAAQFKAFRDLGLFAETPVDVDGHKIVPRNLLQTLLEPALGANPETRDAIIARVIVTGRSNDRPTEAVVDLRVRYAEELGFTAMEQSTGWHAAIVCALLASGQVSPGAVPVEEATDSALILREGRARGFEISENVRFL